METPNYHLYVEDNDQILFKEWRTRLNGTVDSNMTKIDEALEQKANKSRAIQARLTRDNWAGSSTPYTQIIFIDELSANQNGIISVSLDADLEARDAARNAMLSPIKQEDGKLTISADGDIPSVDIPVTILLID